MSDISIHKCDDCQTHWITQQAYNRHSCNGNTTNNRILNCVDCGTEKRLRSTGMRQKAKCYNCGEMKTFEDNE